jgi:hypothetical protein
MKRFAIALILLAMNCMTAVAIKWWHDPDRGCGTLEGWQRTQRISDMPGCAGELPKGAPVGEVVMHDAKVSLAAAEKILDDHRTAGAQELIDRALGLMNRAPNDPRVNWARAHYMSAANILKTRLMQAGTR